MFVPFLSNVEVRHDGPTADTTTLFAVFVTKRVQTWCDKYYKYSFIDGFYSFIYFPYYFRLAELSLSVSLCFLTKLFLVSILLHYSPSL